MKANPLVLNSKTNLCPMCNLCAGCGICGPTVALVATTGIVSGVMSVND